jgi:hypothetical protein
MPIASTIAKQCDRNDQRGDDRGAQVLQEQQHHQEHQHHRLDQRLHHFLDRDLDEGGAVERREPLDACGEGRLQLVHARGDGFGHRQCVRARLQHDGDRTHRLAVELGIEAVTLCADLHTCHVAKAHQRTIAVGTQDDLAELFGRTEAAFRGNGRGEALPLGRRVGTDGTGGELGVL